MPFLRPTPPALTCWADVKPEPGADPEPRLAFAIMDLTESAPPLADDLAQFTLLPRYIEDMTYELGELRRVTAGMYKDVANGVKVDASWAYETVIRLLVQDAKKLIKENVELRAKLDGREGDTLTPSSSGIAPSGGRPFFSSNPSSRSQSGESLGAPPADHASQQHSQHHSAAGGSSHPAHTSDPRHSVAIDDSTPTTVGSSSAPLPFPTTSDGPSLFLPMVDPPSKVPSLHLAAQPLGSMDHPPRPVQKSGMTDPFKTLAMGHSGLKRAHDGSEDGAIAKRNLYPDGRDAAGDVIDEDDDEELDDEPAPVLE